jgi:hypothetical protein
MWMNTVTVGVLQAIAAVIAAYAALLGGLYAIVTRPLLLNMEGIGKRMDRMDGKLDRIEAELKAHGERLTRVEERLQSPLVRR